MKYIRFFISLCFFRVSYIENKEDEHKSGYYLKKREWVWLILFPMVFAGYSVYLIFTGLFELVNYIFSYDCHWVNAKKKKLTFMQTLYLHNRLMN